MEAPQQPRQPCRRASAGGGDSYAAIAVAGDPAQGFTVVRNKRTGPKAPKALKPLYDPSDQKVTLQLHPSTPPAEDVQTTWRYLRLANKAVREYQKNTDYCFILLRHTEENPGPSDLDQDQGPRPPPLPGDNQDGLRDGRGATSYDNRRRTQVEQVHRGVPDNCTVEEVALSIQQSYPDTLKLA